jgi:hypothetical protein
MDETVESSSKNSMKKQRSSSPRTETKRETEREEGTQRARERREERGRPLAWQSLEHMPSSLSGVYVCVSVKSTGFLQPLLLAFFIFCLLCTVSCSLLGFRLRLWLSVVLVGLFAFSSFSCCYCSNLFVWIVRERYKLLFVEIGFLLQFEV